MKQFVAKEIQGLGWVVWDKSAMMPVEVMANNEGEKEAKRAAKNYNEWYA